MEHSSRRNLHDRENDLRAFERFDCVIGKTKKAVSRLHSLFFVWRVLLAAEAEAGTVLAAAGIIAPAAAAKDQVDPKDALDIASAALIAAAAEQEKQEP